ncbi:branched-chain alpha-keto acid dehydrogenase E1-alpha subunit [Fomitopsis serialis]|uniref:branched-chain alpha-keto acid dehydrogenase E1-alpha subunit n=1 Tax=Fomitopsis serialis TaxID=139415 RepID=UPI002008B400|nr:branched-chain alpha-keto acid dehydrogenase E1-alpha subunit [Neoantrodia serialis]KAH9920467.1 branched-chain alpha-keto acid dehydrogenase E1-alpha subunit [Neoantrodia serialis]
MLRAARTSLLKHQFAARTRSISSTPTSGPAKSFPKEPTVHGLLPSSQSPIVSTLKFFNSVTGDGTQIPTYRVLDSVGQPVEGATLPEEIDEAMARRMYESMAQLPIIDNLMYNVQRQGKLAFYMTHYGEEATLIGSAAALANDDEVLGQYRELGVLMWRGFTLADMMNSSFGNCEDPCSRGKQMPMHFGSRKHHFHMISSPLATQIPQAAGVAFALRRDPARRGKNCAAVYFGEGAASEGDFHAGMLFASTIPSPTLFIARNNGFAISTPATEQFYGDGIAARGPGYGIHTVRVDGNDVLAVYNAVKEARRLCIEESRGVLVEAMTYRVGHHSTSDDSFAYRPRQEVEDRKRLDDPLARFRRFLEARGWWSAGEEDTLRARLKDEVLKAFKKAEVLPKPALHEMFEEVYGGEEPWILKEQREELGRLLKKYGDVWEPWKTELKKFKGEGRELMDQKS